jgi:hypothetical protein
MNEFIKTLIAKIETETSLKFVVTSTGGGCNGLECFPIEGNRHAHWLLTNRDFNFPDENCLEAAFFEDKLGEPIDFGTFKTVEELIEFLFLAGQKTQGCLTVELKL